MTTERFCNTCKYIAIDMGTGICAGCNWDNNKRNWVDKNEGVSGVVTVENMINVVFAKFKNSDKQYVYIVPNNVELILDDTVYVTGRYNQELVVTCSTNSFEVTPSGFTSLLLGLNIESPIQKVIGRAKKTYVKVEF